MFTDKKVQDPQMVALRKKVKAKVVPGYKDTEAKVTITAKGGKKYSAYVDTPKGDPRNPPTDEELENKFRSLAPSVLPQSKIDRLVKAIWSLERLDDVRRLISLLH
jgi:2-methylcitrate dehydratase PrpD